MTERLFILLPESEHPMQLADASANSPTLTLAVVKPTDLTDTRGYDITLQRLQEMVDNYDPTIEMASLNFDHTWGGPSLGWCDSVWLQDGVLWAHFIDLAPEAVAGIQERRYTRQSAEVVFDHSETHTWYLTAVALLGNARPEIKGLPPVMLCSRTVFKKESLVPTPNPAVEPPANPEPPPTTTTPPAPPDSAELAALRVQVAEGAQLTARLRRDHAELAAARRLDALGARLTPAMRKLAQPLLVELLAAERPATVQLAAEPNAAATAVNVVDRIFEVLAAAPSVEALGSGRLAEADPPEARTSHLSAEREAELAAKYKFKTHGFGFRPASEN